MAMQLFTPRQYLQIDIASNFGLDKKTWDERLAWFAAHEQEIDKIDITKSSTFRLVREAKEPALFVAGILALRRATEGKPIGYTISLDATSSGAQILAALVCDRDSALECNVVDSNERKNLYGVVHQLMQNQLGDAFTLSPEAAKTAVMTALYGSEAEPRKAFNFDKNLLKAFYHVMSTDLRGIWQLNCDLLSLWDPTAWGYEWTLPDNFHVKFKAEDDIGVEFAFNGTPYRIKRTINRPTEDGKAIPANLVHSIDGMIVREVLRRCAYDAEHIASLMKLVQLPFSEPLRQERPQDALVRTLWSHYQQSGFLSARILELLDIHNIHLVDKAIITDMLKKLPERPFNVLTVHD